MEVDQSNCPRGEKIDLSVPQEVMNFMNKQMDDKSKLFASCRILSEKQRNIKMSGRGAAIAQTAEKFRVFVDPKGKPKVVLKLPVNPRQNFLQLSAFE